MNRGGSMRKAIIGVSVVLLAVAAVAYSQRVAIARFALQPVVERAIARDLTASLPDGLHLGLCGAGSPLPDPIRSGPCVVVIAGKSVFVVDAGSGGARNLQPMGVPTGKVAAALLTHFHSDHIDGLGELGMLRWIGAAHAAPLPVYGPPGVEEVVAGFNRAYAADSGYRTAHHGDAVAPPSGAGLEAQPFVVANDGAPIEVWNQAGVRITAFAVEHAPVSPAVGYRFEYGGRALVISGDTTKSAAVAAQARGADLLVHEALDVRLVAAIHRAAVKVGNEVLAKITSDIPDYHTTPVEAAETAAEAGVSTLLYYHIVPALRFPGLEAVFLEGVADVYAGRVVVGRDGTFVSLPAGTATVEVSSLL